MNNSIKTSFVEEYKVILDIKKEHNFKVYNTSGLGSVFFATLVIIGIFSFIGYISESFANHYYVILSANTVLISGFAIYRASQETRFRDAYNLYYKTSTAILPDILSLSSIVFSVNSLFLVFFMLENISLIFILVNFALIFICMRLYIKLTKAFNVSGLVSNFFKNTLILLIIFIANFYLMGISNFSLAYTFSIVLVVIFCLYNSRMLYNRSLERFVTMFTILFAALLIIAGIFTVRDETEETGFLGKNYSFIENQNFTDELLISNIIFHNDSYIYYHTDTKLYILDDNFNVLEEYTHNLDNVIDYFAYNKLFYLSTKEYSDNVYTYRIFEYNASSITEVAEFKYSEELEFVRYIEFEEDKIIITLENEKLYAYQIEDNFNLREYSFTENNIIIYQDSYQAYVLRYSRLMYINNSSVVGGPFTHMFYSNGRIFFEELFYLDNYYVIEITDFFQLINKDPVYFQTKDNFVSFYYNNDNRYYFVYKDSENNFTLDIHNSVLNNIDSIEDLDYTYITKNGIINNIYSNESISSDRIYYLDFKIEN